MAERYPVYAEADITVDSVDGPPETTVGRVIAELQRYFGAAAAAAGTGAGPAAARGAEA